MKSAHLLPPGYRITEYRLVLSCQEELRNRIAEIRKRFNEEFGIEAPLRARPDLCLVRFSQYEMMEERLINRLRTVAMGYPPFKIELKDFGSYPTHSVFIRVATRLPVQELVKQIRTEAGKLLKLNEEHKPHFLQEPVMTIASRLLPWQYEKGWLQLSHRQFTGRFIADAMLLLRRPSGEKAWKISARLELQNLPVHIRQGGLF